MIRRLPPFAAVAALVAAAPLSAAPLSAAPLSAAPLSAAPPSLDLSGTLRVRYEAIGGQARTGFNRSDDLLNLRTTLAARYTAGALRIGAELYDSRAYGAHAGTPLTTGEVDTLELVQAYVGVTLPDALGAGTRLDVQAGRFLLNLGSRRLVAADDYRNTTNSFTGIRADLAAPGAVTATLLYTLPQSRRPDDFAGLRDNRVAVDREGLGLVLWGGTIAKARALGPALLEATFLHLGERDTPGRPTRDRSLDTYGARIVRDPAPNALDYELEAIRQTGSIRTSLAPAAARQPVRASFVHAGAGYTFAGRLHPHLSIAFDRASGDGRGARYGRFDTLFGMRRGDLAPAGLYNAIGRANLVSPNVRVEAGTKRTDAMLSYRALWLADARDTFAATGVRDPAGASGRFAGNQLDARARHWLIANRLRLEADAVLLFKGRFLRTAPNATSERTTRYLSLNATAMF